MVLALNVKINVEGFLFLTAFCRFKRRWSEFAGKEPFATQGKEREREREKSEVEKKSVKSFFRKSQIQTFIRLVKDRWFESLQNKTILFFLVLEENKSEFCFNGSSEATKAQKGNWDRRYIQWMQYNTIAQRTTNNFLSILKYQIVLG